MMIFDTIHFHVPFIISRSGIHSTCHPASALPHFVKAPADLSPQFARCRPPAYFRRSKCRLPQRSRHHFPPDILQYLPDLIQCHPFSPLLRGPTAFLPEYSPLYCSVRCSTSSASSLWWQEPPLFPPARQFIVLVVIRRRPGINVPQTAELTDAHIESPTCPSEICRHRFSQPAIARDLYRSLSGGCIDLRHFRTINRQESSFCSRSFSFCKTTSVTLSSVFPFVAVGEFPVT